MQGINFYEGTQVMFQPHKLLTTGISAMDTPLFASTLQAGDNCMSISPWYNSWQYCDRSLSYKTQNEHTLWILTMV